MHIFKFRISAALGILLLFALIAIIPSISLSEPSLSEPSLSKSEVTDLKRAKKSEIKKLQEHLRSKDFEIAKDGIYGDKTKEAILGNRKNGGSASAKDLGLTLAIQTILEKKPKSASKPDPAKDKDPKLPAPNPAKYKDSELPAQIEDPKTLVTDKIRHVDKNVNDISKKTKPPNTGENNKAPLKEVETINNNEPSFWEGIGSIAGFILTAAIAAVAFNVWFFKKNQAVSDKEWINEKTKISNDLKSRSEEYLSRMTTIHNHTKNTLNTITGKVDVAKADITKWTASEFSKNKEELNDSLEKRIEGCVEDLAEEHSNHLTALVMLRVSMAQWRQFDKLSNDEKTLYLKRSSINDSISLAKHAYDYALKLNGEKNKSIKNQCISMYAYTLADGCKRLGEKRIYVEKYPMKKARELIEELNLKNLKIEKPKRWYRIIDTYIFVIFVDNQHPRAENMFRDLIWDNNDIEQDWKTKRLSIYQGFESSFFK